MSIKGGAWNRLGRVAFPGRVKSEVISSGYKIFCLPADDRRVTHKLLIAHVLKCPTSHSRRLSQDAVTRASLSTRSNSRTKSTVARRRAAHQLMPILPIPIRRALATESASAIAIVDKVARVHTLNRVTSGTTSRES